MAGALGNLLIVMTADTAQARADIGKAAHEVERDMQDMQVAATAAGVVIATAITAVGRSFANAAIDAINFGDQLSKMAQKTNFSVERLSEMSFAAELADVSIGQMNTGLGMFNKVLSDAAKEGSKASGVFKALGVDITQGPQVAFEQFAKAINALPDGETKVATMRAVFWRAGDALLPLIKGLDDATEKAQKLGLVMSKQMAQDSERFNDAMTVIGTTTRAVALTAMKPLAGWLAEVSENMIAARLNGNALSVSFMEMGKTFALFSSDFGRTFGLKRFADTMEAEFNRLDKLVRLQTTRTGAQLSGGEAANIDQNALSNAVAGVRDPKVKTGRATRDQNLFGRQLQEDMDVQAKIMSEAAAAADKYNQTVRDREAAEVKAAIAAQVAHAESIVQMDELIAQQTLLNNGFDETGKAIAENTKKTSDWGREMGLTFSSAFEDMIAKGAKFSDVLRGILQDMIKIAGRKLVTEPMGNAFGSLLETGLGLLFGGGKAAGGPVAGGTTYLVGERGPELFTPGVGGNITPNHAMGGGDTYYIDARGADKEGLQRLEQMIYQVNGSIERRALGAVSNSRARRPR